MAAGPVPVEQLTNVPRPYAPLSEAQRYTIIPPTTQWTNQYAVQVVRDTFEASSRFRQQAGLDNRFYESDELLAAWRPKKVWDGTRKPRASIPVALLLSQLQSLLPNVLQAIFPLRENVEAHPRPGSTMESAISAYELIMSQLDSLGEDGLTRFRDVAMEAFTQGFLYGNGVTEVSWLYKQMPRITYYVDWEVPRRQVLDPFSGDMFMAPAGPPQRVVREQVNQLTWNQPDINTIDIRDCYPDPNARHWSIQHRSMRYFATRHFPTVGELLAFAGQPYFNIPNDRVLITMADQKPIEAADNSKKSSASLFGRQWNPMDDYTADPYQRRVELVRWYSRERCVWTINRYWCFYNRTNPYGIIPFLNSYYVPFPNRWHGMSLADVTEGNQNLIASLLEARMDGLTLAIMAPWIRKQGTMLTGQQLFVHPGKVVDVNDEPDKAIKRLETKTGDATQQVFVEVNDAYGRTARDTGLSDMAVMGVPTAGGNSANRTAEGISRQAAAVGARIQFLVENEESSYIEPLLTIMHQFNVKFLPRDQMVNILGQNGDNQQLDPVQVLNANPRFIMRASARARQRNQLMQVLPWFVQTIMNPEFIGMMGQQQKKTLDIEALMNLVTETLNVPKFALWRKMTPQEIQAMSQPSPDQVMESQRQGQRLAATAEAAQDRDEAKLMQALVSALLTPRVAEDALGLEDTEEIKQRIEEIKLRQAQLRLRSQQQQQANRARQQNNPRRMLSR